MLKTPPCFLGSSCKVFCLLKQSWLDGLCCLQPSPSPCATWQLPFCLRHLYAAGLGRASECTERAAALAPFCNRNAGGWYPETSGCWFGSTSLVGGGIWELTFHMSAAEAPCAHLNAQFARDESAVFKLNGAETTFRVL